jgi:pimeloyl-ACP methyl ester carboxylesterase
MPEATINGVRIHYNVSGAGDPLLLIMGYGMPGDAWLPSIPLLQGFRSIYYDNRGTGRSEKPEGPFTIAAMAEDAAGLLRHLGVDRAHIYGISMGGMIAQELVLRHPELVRSLVLGCTMCGGEHAKPGDPEVLDALFDVVRSMGSADPAAWVEKQLPLLFPKEWVDANPGIRGMLLMAAQMMPKTPPETAHRAMEGIMAWTTYDRLAQIKAPTLIIHGDKDVIIPVQNAYVLAERIPGAKLHIVKGAGHGYPAQDPIGIHKVITDFFRSTDRNPS